MLNIVKSYKEPDMNKLMEVDTIQTTIEIFKDKIVWDNLGQKTKINDNMVTLKGMGGKTVKLELIINEDNINLKFKEEKLVCILPFKKRN